METLPWFRKSRASNQSSRTGGRLPHGSGEADRHSQVDEGLTLAADHRRLQAISNLQLHALPDVFGITLRLLARGQTNFLRMLWKFGGVYTPDRLMQDHERPVRYAIRLPANVRPTARPAPAELYVHRPGAVVAHA